ncbi:hypothetical protein [Thalassospira sp. HF15]|uniref:hypothetical protein n=1 Tax=Thalassospira sp. HF15 TaxID=2722755 RepID=UPI00142F6B70|nr:hypothetical protein [Thalassospira sp. HF15]
MKKDAEMSRFLPIRASAAQQELGPFSVRPDQNILSLTAQAHRGNKLRFSKLLIFVVGQLGWLDISLATECSFSNGYENPSLTAKLYKLKKLQPVPNNDTSICRY